MEREVVLKISCIHSERTLWKEIIYTQPLEMLARTTYNHTSSSNSTDHTFWDNFILLYTTTISTLGRESQIQTKRETCLVFPFSLHNHWGTWVLFNKVIHWALHIPVSLQPSNSTYSQASVTFFLRFHSLKKQTPAMNIISLLVALFAVQHIYKADLLLIPRATYE